MKIIFDRDISKHKLKKDKEYFVISREGEKHSVTYMIFNDDNYLTIIIRLGRQKYAIYDRELILNGSYKSEFIVSEIESNIQPKLTNPFEPENEHYIHDLIQGKSWAITKFSKKLISLGINVNEEYRQIAFQDVTKIYYVQAEMSALFSSICNFFDGCGNMQYHTTFDKHYKSSISLLTLASISYNRSSAPEAKDVTNLDILKNWQLDLKETLYSELTINSSFGVYIQNNNLQESAVYERECLRFAIIRIVLTIESIFDENEVKVYKVPMDELNISWSQYCLIFETPNNFYRFYLGRYD